MIIQIIPAIDLLGGRCVRLHQGKFEELTTYDVPVENMLDIIKDAGFNRVHIVDLDGARMGEPVQLELIAGLAKQYNLYVQTGGGYRSAEQVSKAIEMGVSDVIIGSAAVKSPQFFVQSLSRFGPEHIILAADVDDGQVRVSAWEEDGGAQLDALLELFIPHGLQKVLITDIRRDGTLTGPNIELYAKLKVRFPRLHIIASGGVAQASDIEQLAAAGVSAVVLGKALYENRLNLEQLSALKDAYVG